MGLVEKFIKFDENYKQPKDETSKEVMNQKEKKDKKHFIRTLGNVYAAAEAQRIYNPQLPPTKIKGPTEAQTQLGSSSAMDLEGNWGTASKQG